MVARRHRFARTGCLRCRGYGVPRARRAATAQCRRTPRRRGLSALRYTDRSRCGHSGRARLAGAGTPRPRLRRRASAQDSRRHSLPLQLYEVRGCAFIRPERTHTGARRKAENCGLAPHAEARQCRVHGQLNVAQARVGQGLCVAALDLEAVVNHVVQRSNLRRKDARALAV